MSYMEQLHASPRSLYLFFPAVLHNYSLQHVTVRYLMSKPPLENVYDEALGIWKPR